MKIWKWTLQITDLQQIEMPIGAEILSVQVQHGLPQVWALVKESNETEKRTFITCGTGNPIPENIGRYLGTYQCDNGALVFHVFAVANQ